MAFENGRVSDFQKLMMTLTMTLDRGHTACLMHHSSTSTYIPNFIEIKETFCGQTDGHLDKCTYGRMGRRTFETHFIRSTCRSRPNNLLTEGGPHQHSTLPRYCSQSARPSSTNYLNKSNSKISSDGLQMTCLCNIFVYLNFHRKFR